MVKFVIILIFMVIITSGTFGMVSEDGCKRCRTDENYFCCVDCVYDFLVVTHPVLWLRDSSLIRPGYISRNLLCPAGNVLAIWNGVRQGWRLRTYKQESLDEVPDPLRDEFVQLDGKDVRFQAFLNMWND